MWSAIRGEAVGCMKERRTQFFGGEKEQKGVETSSSKILGKCLISEKMLHL